MNVLKITQDIVPAKFKYVPTQDFTLSSDIDWSKSISDIDKQLKIAMAQEQKDGIAKQTVSKSLRFSINK